MSKINAVEKGISYLLREIPKGKVNPRTLGWIRPDGVINFQTSVVAQNYAKNRCLAALHEPKPVERAVFIEDSRIIGDVKGTAYHVKFDKKMLDGYKDVVSVHGHPVGTPLSPDDYSALIMDDRLKSVVAYNKRGEYSKMTKRKRPFIFKLLPQKVWDNVKKIRILTAESMVKTTDNDWQEFIVRVVKIKNAYPSMQIKEVLATEEGKKIQDFARRLLSKINDIWAKNEKFFGIKYETNFSKIVNIS